jgi:hypothetical protein
MRSAHVFPDSHGGEGIDEEELLHNIEHEDLLEYRKRGLDNLEMMDKASKVLLYEESKGCDKECIVLQTSLIFSHQRQEMGGQTQASTSYYNF